MSPGEKKDALREIEEAAQLGLDLAAYFRFGLPIKMTVADFKAKWGVAPSDANALYIEKATAALSLLPRLRAVVEAANSLTEINHWVERLAHYFGVERANGMSDALAALEGEEEKP